MTRREFQDKMQEIIREEHEFVAMHSGQFSTPIQDLHAHVLVLERAVGLLASQIKFDDEEVPATAAETQTVMERMLRK